MDSVGERERKEKERERERGESKHGTIKQRERKRTKVDRQTLPPRLVQASFPISQIGG